MKLSTRLRSSYAALQFALQAHRGSPNSTVDSDTAREVYGIH